LIFVTSARLEVCQSRRLFVCFLVEYACDRSLVLVGILRCQNFLEMSSVLTL